MNEMSFEQFIKIKTSVAANNGDVLGEEVISASSTSSG
jgi:hypothetical protein